MAKRKTAGQLLQEVVELLIQHVATATEPQRRKATVEALAAAQAAGASLHAFTCCPHFCPREHSERLTEFMLNDLGGALSRVFGNTGYVQ